MNFKKIAAGCLFLFSLLSWDPSKAADQASVNSSGYSQAQKNNREINENRFPYILGPGDTVNIEVFGIRELSGLFTIGPDGTVYLPRLRALYVEGLTIDEFSYFLTDQFKEFIKQPKVYISPYRYRPVRVYVGGEVARPGYYVISYSFGGDDVSSITKPDKALITSRPDLSDPQPDQNITNTLRWPTLFDAIQAAQGATPFSDLSRTKVIRARPKSLGGGKIAATINFLDLITNGDESVNVKLFDGDVINVSKSDVVLRDQLLAATKTNLSPAYISVFISGRVQTPGPQTLRQGATLNQAIASAGGPKLLRGSIDFVRFDDDGQTDRRRFSLNTSAKAGSYKNPILMAGDVIRVNDSILSAGVEVLNEITGPAVGIYSVYSLFKP